MNLKYKGSIRGLDANATILMGFFHESVYAAYGLLRFVDLTKK